MKSIIIIGGDRRQSYLKDIFLENGYICDHINSDEKNDILREISKFDAVMLPLPLSKDKEHIYSDNSSFSVKIKDIIGRMNDNQFLVAGTIDKALIAYLSEKKIDFFDYFECEDFVIYNAYLTAQGALRLLLENTNEFLRSKKALVTGFGRVARAVSETLKNNGMDVYIAARNPVQLEEAFCRGFKIIEIDKLSSRMFVFDHIFNAVPTNIFSKDDINHFSGKYFELASAPFGTDRAYFNGRPDDYIDGGALPGKYLPISSAKKIAEITLEHIINRKGGD